MVNRSITCCHTVWEDDTHEHLMYEPGKFRFPVADGNVCASTAVCTTTAEPKSGALKRANEVPPESDRFDRRRCGFSLHRQYLAQVSATACCFEVQVVKNTSVST